MGKLPVVVKDGPGFLVNRLLVPYLIEAAWLLEDGMACEVVDLMYKNEFACRLGPFALMDEVASMSVSRFRRSSGSRSANAL